MHRTSACRSCYAHYYQIQNSNQFEISKRERLLDDHICKDLVGRDRVMLYCHDVYHDLIEGVLPLFLWEVIKKNYRNQDIVHLNEKIKECSWINGSIKPIDLSKKKFSCTSGMQLFEFFIKFSAIDSKLDRNGIDFKMYTNLRRIICVVLQLEITESDLVILKENAESFVQRYIDNFEHSVTFKVHFLLHYEKFIRLYGPIWLYCTLRFERKHQMILNLIRSSFNNIDIPKQVIRWYLIKKTVADDENICVSNNNSIEEFRKFEYKKIEFIKDRFYIISKTSSGFHFGECDRIYKERNQLKVLVIVYKTIKFDKSKLCYVIQPTDEHFYLNIENNYCHITLYTLSENETILVQRTF